MVLSKSTALTVDREPPRVEVLLQHRRGTRSGQDTASDDTQDPEVLGTVGSPEIRKSFARLDLVIVLGKLLFGGRGGGERVAGVMRGMCGSVLTPCVMLRASLSSEVKVNKYCYIIG